MFRQAANRTFRAFEKESNLEWKGPFRFIQAADSQFGLIDELSYVDWSGPVEAALEASRAYKARASSVWTEELRLAQLAIKQWNSMTPRPAFIVVCGDLVNEFPGHQQRPLQVADFKRTFRELDAKIPLVLLPGNHDLLNRPTEAAVEAYRADFGDDYFSFWVGGVFFIVINVQYHKDPQLVPALAAEHERWLDRQLEEVKEHQGSYKHIIVFQHIPWFLRHIDEPDDEIFNIAINERRHMVSKFSAAGVRAIFAGHYHRNAGGHFEEMELVVTSAMGAVMRDPLTGVTGRSGYRVVDVEETELKHRFVEIEDDSSGGGGGGYPRTGYDKKL